MSEQLPGVASAVGRAQPAKQPGTQGEHLEAPQLCSTASKGAVTRPGGRLRRAVAPSPAQLTGLCGARVRGARIDGALQRLAIHALLKHLLLQVWGESARGRGGAAKACVMGSGGAGDMCVWVRRSSLPRGIKQLFMRKRRREAVHSIGAWREAALRRGESSACCWCTPLS